MPKTLGELYIVITDNQGNTVAGVREDLNTPITSRRMPKSLRYILDDNNYIMGLLMEAQRIVDRQEKDSRGRFKK